MFNEFPGGSVNESTFKEIYEKFFPYGNKNWSGVVHVVFQRMLKFVCSSSKCACATRKITNIQTRTTAISPRSVTFTPNFNFKIASR